MSQAVRETNFGIAVTISKDTLSVAAGDLLGTDASAAPTAATSPVGNVQMSLGGPFATPPRSEESP